MIFLPVTAGMHSTLLYFVLTKYFKIHTIKSLKISLISFALLPLYALIMVKSFDSFGKSWTKLKYLFWRLFNRNFYDDLNAKKK